MSEIAECIRDCSGIKDLLVFFMNAPGTRVPEHLRWQLAEYHKAGMRILMLGGTRDVGKERLPQLKREGLIDDVVAAKAFNHPFPALRELLRAATPEDLSGIGTFWFSTGRNFGPFIPAAELIRRRDDSGAEFWGIANYCDEDAVVMEMNFFSLSGKALRSELFRRLVAQADSGDRSNSAKMLELSRLLTKNFSFATWVKLSDERPIKVMRFEPPFSINAADRMIRDYGMPLLPLAAFKAGGTELFSISGNIVRALRERFPEYPEKPMLDHLREVSPLSTLKNCPGMLRILKVAREAEVADFALKVAVKAHLFYEDSLPIAVDALKNIPSDFDLYCTTCSEQIARMLREQTRAALPRLRRLEVVMVKNRGRDILPWLTTFAETEKEYDVILKFQVKKRLQQPSVLGQTWYNYNLACLLGSAAVVSDILKMFRDEPDLGVVFPSYPPVITATSPYAYRGSAAMQAMFRKTFRRCAPGAPAETGIPIFPAGTIFWYRPAAVRPLFAAGFKSEEFPPEPLPPLTLAHIIERMVPYAAQSAGYGCRLVMAEEELLPAYQLFEDRLLALHRTAPPESLPLFMNGFIPLFGATCKAFAYAITKRIASLKSKSKSK